MLSRAAQPVLRRGRGVSWAPSPLLGATLLFVTDVVFESTHTMTAEAFAEWLEHRQPSDINHYELLHGRIVMTPPAGYPHGEVESNLQEAVRRAVRAAAWGRVFGSSQGFELPSGDTVEPDLSIVSSARWAAGPAPVVGKFLRVVPDIVFEILSGATASRDRGEKKAIYEASGVREYWLVDARAREITVFALEAGRFGPERVFVDSETALSAVLPGLTVSVADAMAG
jgi:Uma2 family endonuclease